MAEKKETVEKKFILIPEVVSSMDIGRLVHETEKLDEFLYQTHLRSPGSSMAMPKTTSTLEKLAEANGMSLTDATHRKHLIGNLLALRTNGKKVHISFAVEPPSSVVQKILAWMRQNIDGNLIMEIGVQPTVSVGCIVRTTNKVFDMSLRNRFRDSKELLGRLVEGSNE